MSDKKEENARQLEKIVRLVEELAKKMDESDKKIGRRIEQTKTDVCSKFHDSLNEKTATLQGKIAEIELVMKQSVEQAKTDLLAKMSEISKDVSFVREMKGRYELLEPKVIRIESKLIEKGWLEPEAKSYGAKEEPRLATKDYST